MLGRDPEPQWRVLTTLTPTRLPGKQLPPFLVLFPVVSTNADSDGTQGCARRLISNDDSSSIPVSGIVVINDRR